MQDLRVSEKRDDSNPTTVLQVGSTWVRWDKVQAQGTHAQFKLLQKALRAESRDWIRNRHSLPLENPAGNREAYRRVPEMH